MDMQFGPFTLQSRERQLSGPEGIVELSSRSFDILMLLLRNANKTVSKTELLEAVWPGIVVEDNTLQVHVSALRKAMGSSVIQTVHGRGYKYCGPPATSLALPPSMSEKVGPKPVLVVLPFQNLSSDPEQQYFSDGITEDLTDRLSRYRPLKVIGQHSAARFRAENPDFDQIRNKLKADFIVTGSVRRTPERIRIAVRLSDATTQATIWAERYDRPIADLFALQDEITKLVAAAIARLLEVEINARTIQKHPANLTSYELTLQGYWHFKKLTPASNQLAKACFERAVALDATNAEALSWLGATYCESWMQNFMFEEAHQGAKLASEAVTIDPASAICHAIQAWTLLCVKDLDRALLASARGMALNRGDPAVLVNRALPLIYDGQHDEAAQLFQEAHALEPIPPLWFGEFQGILAFAEGRYDEAIKGFEVIPDVAWDIMYLLACHGHLNRKDEAQTVLRRLQLREGRSDFLYGAGFEPYRNAEPRQRLIEGLQRALSWAE